MAPPVKLVWCPCCGADKPASSFRTSEVTGKRLSHKAETCCECRSSGASAAVASGVWDWAAALCKATSMSVDHACRRDPRQAPWSPRLDAMLVRGLHRLQEGRCALTGEQLLLPPRHVLIPAHTTLESWIGTLTDEAAGHVPALIRTDPRGEWAPGQVVLVASAVAPLVAWAGGLVEARTLMLRARVPAVPTPQALTLVRPEVEKEARELWREGRKREKEEQKRNEAADAELGKFVN